ncbi:bacterioopsin transcriptional activator [Halalkalicoccus paucihalophilus]|uniref:histidine kinase n=2 Tax=Halalkalicoccus paucihalophilus TaxID=1008153 RepID=A0A151A9Y2_9EURY|nr:bacterioopsin transcriptional activator [Halalkalicoccus paucihalophilus]
MEPKRTEGVLHKYENRYRELFESIDEGVLFADVVFDRDGQPLDILCREANPAVMEIYDEDFEGRWLTEIKPSYGSDLYEIFDRVASTGESERHQEYATVDETWYDFYVFKPGRAGSRRVAVVFQDITERKRLEEELQIEKEQLNVAVENSQLTLFRVDADLRYTWCKNLRGDLEKKEVLGKRDDELLPPAAADAVIAPKQTALNTGERVRQEVTYESPSGEVTYDLMVAPLRNESGAIAGLTGAAFELTEHKRTQRQLADERDMFTEGPAVVFRWDPNAGEGWPVEYVSENVERLLGYTAEELTAGEITYTDLLIDEEVERIAQEVEENSDGTTKRFSHAPYRIKTKDGDIRWVKDTTKIVYDDSGSITHYLGYLIDITDRKETHDALEQLNTASRELMESDTQEIKNRITDFTESVLGVEYTALWHYDRTTGDFRQYTRSTTQEVDSYAIDLSDEISEQIWQTFISNDIDLANDLSSSPMSPRSKSALNHLLLIPLGRHGVLCAGSTREATLDETTVDLAKTLGATIEAAWDRADGEQQLAKQNEELARLDRLNSLIRTIDDALVEADSLEEIDRAVCEQLAESNHYEFAWIGERDPTTETVTPREWAGIDSNYVDNLEIPIDESSSECNPIGTAIRTQETQIVSDLTTETRFIPLREGTLKRGARSCISVPLVYEESLYGVLTAYADQPSSDERNHAVLAELGRTIAHTINAVETRETLPTDRVVELTLQCREPNTPLCQLASQTECTIEFEGLVSQSTGEADVLFTAKDISSEELQIAGEQSVAIEELICLNERNDETLFRARVTDSTLAARFVEQGAAVRSLIIEKGMATAVVNLSHTADAREFVERLQQTVPKIDLIGRHTRNRALKTRQTFRMVCEDRLTEKQLAALQTAYLSGFFESPRVRTGKEVAASMDISQPTFSNHLRAAQRGVYEVLFDERKNRSG